MTATPRYYPAEDVKASKPTYRVKQNVSMTMTPMELIDRSGYVRGVGPKC